MISDKAVVSKNAKIGAGVEIGPFAIVEDGAEIGANVKIWPNAYVCTGTTIGEGSQIHMGTVVGHLPQDLGFKNQKTHVKIGRNTVVREYATVHRATVEGHATKVGDNCYLMAVSHVGHDCHIGNNVILSNCALLAGHVSVGDFSFVSGNVVVHQFCRIGTLAMIGGFTGINKDVPPYMLVRGPSVVRSVNLVGLRRAKFPRELIESIKDAYKFLFQSNLNTAQAIEEMGWAVVIAVRPLLATLPTGGLALLVAGGLSYTVGVLFYVLRGLRYHHAYWHGFVLLGSAAHFFAVLFYVVPGAP